MPNPSIVAYSFRDLSFYTDRRTDGHGWIDSASDPDQGGQADMARSTRLVILIKNIYALWGRKRFRLPVTYFPTNLVYPFTLRVTGIKIFSTSVGQFYFRVSTEL